MFKELFTESKMTDNEKKVLKILRKKIGKLGVDFAKLSKSEAKNIVDWYGTQKFRASIYFNARERELSVAPSTVEHELMKLSDELGLTNIEIVDVETPIPWESGEKIGSYISIYKSGFRNSDVSRYVLFNIND